MDEAYSHHYSGWQTGVTLRCLFPSLCMTLVNQRWRKCDGCWRGAFHSGIWHGSVPDKAEIQIQIGFGPNLSPEDILLMARTIASEISDRIQVNQSLLATPACAVPEDNLLVHTLKSIVARNSGKEVRTVAVTGHCDMRHFSTQSICLYGPGAGWNAHGIDEAYRLDDMAIVARNLAEFTIDWCGVVGSDRELD